MLSGMLEKVATLRDGQYVVDGVTDARVIECILTNSIESGEPRSPPSVGNTPQLTPFYDKETFFDQISYDRRGPPTGMSNHRYNNKISWNSSAPNNYQQHNYRNNFNRSYGSKYGSPPRQSAFHQNGYQRNDRGMQATQQQLSIMMTDLEEIKLQMKTLCECVEELTMKLVKQQKQQQQSTPAVEAPTANANNEQQQQ